MSWEEDVEECRQHAIDAGALKPQGLQERMAAGVMEYNGQSWSNTPVAQERLAEWTRECLRRKGYDV